MLSVHWSLLSILQVSLVQLSNLNPCFVCSVSFKAALPGGGEVEAVGSNFK